MNKSFFRLTFLLFFICAASTALVAGAHNYTKNIIADRAAAQILEGYKQVLPAAGKLSKETGPTNSPIKEICRSTQGDKINGYIYTVAPKGYAGEVTIMVGIENPSMKITGVKILSQQETPGLGAKCTEPEFLNQFTDKDLHKNLIVSKNAKNSQEIQAITASTITSRAVVSGINAVSEHYSEHFAK